MDENHNEQYNNNYSQNYTQDYNQNNNYNQGYTQNYTPPQQEVSPTVKIGEWLITMILCAIPFVNVIMLLIWAFSAGTAPSKKNWARANLIYVVACMVFLLFFTLIL